MSIEKRLDKIEKQNELIISLLTNKATEKEGVKNEFVSTKSATPNSKDQMLIKAREQYFKQ